MWPLTKVVVAVCDDIFISFFFNVVEQPFTSSAGLTVPVCGQICPPTCLNVRLPCSTC